MVYMRTSACCAGAQQILIWIVDFGRRGGGRALLIQEETHRETHISVYLYLYFWHWSSIFMGIISCVVRHGQYSNKYIICAFSHLMFIFHGKVSVRAPCYIIAAYIHIYICNIRVYTIAHPYI